MIMDNLEVMPMSTICSLNLLYKLSVKDGTDLRRKLSMWA